MSKETISDKRILIAEDDDDHYLVTECAFKAAHLNSDLFRVKHGEALLDYLNQKGSYAKDVNWKKPSLILLDLNMPKMGGREALRQISASPEMKQIPVIVLTTMTNPEDESKCYEWGAKCFFQKPISFKEFVSLFESFKNLL